MPDDRMVWSYDGRTGVWKADTTTGRYTARWSGYQFIAQLETVTIGTGTDIGEVRRAAENDHAERLRKARQSTVVPTPQLLAAMRAAVNATGRGRLVERDVAISTVNRIAKILGIDATWEDTTS